MTFIDKPKPLAGCPLCEAPLIATLEFPKKEWICLGCNKVWEFLSARSIEPTFENLAKLAEFQERYKKERAERRRLGTEGEFKSGSLWRPGGQTP